MQLVRPQTDTYRVHAPTDRRIIIDARRSKCYRKEDDKHEEGTCLRRVFVPRHAKKVNTKGMKGSLQ